MKTAILAACTTTILFFAGCVVERTSVSEQGLHTVCDPISGECWEEGDGGDSGGGGVGGGGGGEGSGGSCDTIDCSSDDQCQRGCDNPTASCVIWNGGGNDHGFCLNW